MGSKMMRMMERRARYVINNYYDNEIVHVSIIFYTSMHSTTQMRNDLLQCLKDLCGFQPQENAAKCQNHCMET